MGIDYIDLWYPHRLDGSTPIEHIVAEMVKMKEYVMTVHLDYLLRYLRFKVAALT